MIVGRPPAEAAVCCMHVTMNWCYTLEGIESIIMLSQSSRTGEVRPWLSFDCFICSILGKVLRLPREEYKQFYIIFQWNPAVSVPIACL